MRAWREHPEHRAAQLSGRTKWYSYHRLDVVRLFGRPNLITGRTFRNRRHENPTAYVTPVGARC